MFPGKYHQSGGCSLAMSLSGSVTKTYSQNLHSTLLYDVFSLLILFVLSPNKKGEFVKIDYHRFKHLGVI